MKKLFTIIFFTTLGLNNIKAATFSSVSSGTWSAPATWTLTSGTDSDTIPDSGDDVTINLGHNVALSTTFNYVKTFVNNGILTGNLKRFLIYGNFTNNGTVNGSSIILYIQSNCVFTSATTFVGAISWWIGGNLTISAGTTISSPNTMSMYSGTSVSNLGSLIIAGGLNLNGTSIWTNGINSSLSVNANIAGTGSLIASSVGNTVQYRNTCTQIKSAIYYNLTILATNSTTRTAQGNINVLNNFTLSGTSTSFNFNLGGFNLTVGGNWLNSVNRTILNQGIITFNGSGTQTISRTSNEVINKMIIGGSGTVLLGRSLDVSEILTINSGIFDVSASNFTVNIAGNLTNNSTINTRSGLFNFNGTVAQTVGGAATNNFYNVTSTNASGVSISSPAVISNLLTVSTGPFGTSGSGTIKIPATAATTYGRIGPVGGSLTGTGWTIESYIAGPATKGWQWLSSPINGNTLADWDNDTRFWMSGVGGNEGTALNLNGIGTFQSVRTYNESAGTRTNITSTTTVLSSCKGYEVYMADNLNAGLTSPLVYNSVGTPNFGNKSIAVTFGGTGQGYNLVGNPYACPITYSAVVAASGNLFSSFIILKDDNTYADEVETGGVIAPNQGFMCVASSAGNIVFTEACKNTVTNPNILRASQNENEVRLTVYNNVNGIGGRTIIQFLADGSDDFVNGKDLTFLASPSEEADNIYTKSSDEKALLRNILINNGKDKSIALVITPGVYGIHHLSVKGLTILKAYKFAWLENLETGEKFNIFNDKDYQFNVKEIGKDLDFVLHFSNEEEVSSQRKSIVSNSLNENTSVYNTPSNVVVKFDMPQQTPVTISVYNLTGQQVITPMNLNVVNDRIALPLQKENGMYLLIIQSKDQKISRKIIF